MDPPTVIPKGSKGDIVIGNDVWIGHGVTILSGVKIGDGAVVGAGSVVVNDVEPYSIAGGVPARTLMWRFPERQRVRLMGIRWWDWPETKIRKFMPLILSHDVDKFIEEADICR